MLSDLYFGHIGNELFQLTNSPAVGSGLFNRRRVSDIDGSRKNKPSDIISQSKTDHVQEKLHPPEASRLIEKRQMLTSETICQICSSKVSKYTCPKCAVKYCTLDCYKHENHLGCTEDFYKKLVIDSMQHTSSSDKEKMQRILLDLHAEDEEQSQGIEDDFEQRFQNCDLDSDDLESKLTREELEKFKLILKSKEALNFLIKPYEPWWITSVNIPDLIESTVKPSNAHPNLLYSIIDLIISYVAAIRSFNGQAEPLELTELILSISLSLRDSFCYESVEEVMDLTKHQLQVNPFGFIKESLIVFYMDLLKIIKDKDSIKRSLSHLALLFKQCKNCHKYYMKMLYFLPLIDTMNDDMLNVFILALGVEEPKWSGKEKIVDLGKPQLIQEIQ